MLIENGAINWRLKPSASSRKLRNGVGIDKQGRVVFMLSERETNFYDFACYAQSKLHVRQMLYLDGTISKMYQKGGSIPWQYHPFVTMIAVEIKNRAKGKWRPLNPEGAPEDQAALRKRRVSRFSISTTVNIATPITVVTNQ